MAVALWSPTAPVSRQRLRSSTLAPDTTLLHRRASAWLEGQGRLHEAISHALAGGAFEHAVVLMERIVRALYGQGALGTLHEALLRQAAAQGIVPAYVRTLLAAGGVATATRDS